MDKTQYDYLVEHSLIAAKQAILRHMDFDATPQTRDNDIVRVLLDEATFRAALKAILNQEPLLNSQRRNISNHLVEIRSVLQKKSFDHIKDAILYHDTKDELYSLFDKEENLYSILEIVEEITTPRKSMQ